MLRRDSEEGIWSRFVTRPKEVTLLSRTQSSGLLCLWHCLLKTCTAICNTYILVSNNVRTVIQKPSWTCIYEATTVRQLPHCQLFNIRIFLPSLGYSKDIFSRRGLGVISETKNIWLIMGRPQPLVGSSGCHFAWLWSVNEWVKSQWKNLERVWFFSFQVKSCRF